MSQFLRSTTRRLLLTCDRVREAGGLAVLHTTHTSLTRSDDDFRSIIGLGVTFVLVDRAMTRTLWKKGLTEWRKRHPVLESDEEDET